MNLVLHIRINGREHFAAPYSPARVTKTARELFESMPALSQQGRVVVFVTDGNVAHLITGSRSAA